MDMMDTEIVFQLFMTLCCNNIKLKLALNAIFWSEKVYATFIHKIFLSEILALYRLPIDRRVCF